MGLPWLLEILLKDEGEKEVVVVVAVVRGRKGQTSWRETHSSKFENKQ